MCQSDSAFKYVEMTIKFKTILHFHVAHFTSAQIFASSFPDKFPCCRPVAERWRGAESASLVSVASVRVVRASDGHGSELVDGNPASGGPRVPRAHRWVLPALRCPPGDLTVHVQAPRGASGQHPGDLRAHDEFHAGGDGAQGSV